ncbi:hypothetical protein [Rhizobium beringeri]|uniref:hypothetical protein n=1 Tax=Rhizobium beringeri TaxID=3019934 RepID=UPI002E112B27|nr:hypothetical protein U8P75_22045 [Rhizobium beringeri]WSH79855.1 hypothetical protein U8P69_21885 [Rhizobium beringeri]
MKSDAAGTRLTAAQKRKIVTARHGVNMKIAGMLAVLLLVIAPHQAEAQRQKPSRPMTKEEGHKLILYALKQCEGFPTASPELVLCIQAVNMRVMKLWNAGQTLSFLR